MTEDKQREEIDALYCDFAQLANLIAALQVIAFDIVELRPGDPIGKERRDAMVGIGNAMERIVADVDRGAVRA